MDTQWLKREIKFRAWDNKHKSFLYDFWVQDGRVMVSNYHSEDDWTSPEYPDVQLMQFTGLKDKNGKAIYEGDIIKNENSENAGDNTYTWISQVMWLADEARWGGADGERLEVIGNVFENPELIK